jgi:hypothetical protein
MGESKSTRIVSGGFSIFGPSAEVVSHAVLTHAFFLVYIYDSPF